MIKNTGHILALYLTASGHVLAHDAWIIGRQAENNVIVETGYSHNFLSKGAIPDRRDFFENPRLYNGKETITLKSASMDYVYKTESVSKDNGYVLSTYMKPGYWSGTSSGWKPASQEGRNDVIYREFATKHAKSLIPGEQQMPAQLYQSPTGHELEIIPLPDTNRLNENVKLKVLYEASSLARAIMGLDSANYLTSSCHTHAVEHKHPVHKAEPAFVTNEDGIATVSSLHIEQWLVKVQNKKSLQNKSLCGETVDVATLSFPRNQ